MADSTISQFVSSGTTAERTAYVPDPPSPAAGPDPAYLWWDTDTQTEWSYDFGLADWVELASGGGGGGLVLLEQHTASSSAALNFTTCISSTYDEYQIDFISIITASSTDLKIQLSTDGGANYAATNYAIGRFILYSTTTYVQSSSTTGLFVAPTNTLETTAVAGLSGQMHLYAPLSATSHKRAHGMISALSTGGDERMVMVVGVWQDTTAVNAFRVIAESGNIASGTVRVYGIEK